MKTDEFLNQVDGNSDSPDAEKPLLVEDHDGRLLEVTAIRNNANNIVLVVGEEVAESRQR
jgi:hypothetical protein